MIGWLSGLMKRVPDGILNHKEPLRTGIAAGLLWLQPGERILARNTATYGKACKAIHLKRLLSGRLTQ